MSDPRTSPRWVEVASANHRGDLTPHAAAEALDCTLHEFLDAMQAWKAAGTPGLIRDGAGASGAETSALRSGETAVKPRAPAPARRLPGPLDPFLADACVLDARCELRADAAYQAYRRWWDAQPPPPGGAQPMSRNRLSQLLGRRFQRRILHGYTIYLGVGVAVPVSVPA